MAAGLSLIYHTDTGMQGNDGITRAIQFISIVKFMNIINTSKRF